jgi:hypothetical protein
MQRLVCYHRLTMRMTLASTLLGNAICRSAAAISLMAGACLAQSSTTPTLRLDPGALVRTAVENEIKASRDENAHFLFRSTRTTSRGAVTKIYIQAKEATAGIVVAYDGKPLTEQQRKDERARVERFLTSPDELEKKRRQEQVDADRMMRIIKALPDAFFYEYSGEQMGSPGVGKTGEPLLALKFRPNPHYDPPSRVEQVLTGMEGTLLLDNHRNRLASIEGTLVKEVGFGWGILGHLDKGGHFLVQHQVIGDNNWFVSRTNVDVTGKILLFKRLVFNMTEVFSDIKPVPKDITFAQAIEVLEKEEAAFANNSAAEAVKDASAR